MAFADVYRRQVGLLIRTLPLVAREQCFALKGGTAINLFVRDMPRLSVDIDLTYLPVQERAASFAAIDAAMKRIAANIKTGIRGAGITEGKAESAVTKLMVRADGVQIKIEVTPVLRGCAYEPELRSVSDRVERQFGFAEMQLVSFPDLYAGKIVAALDRQHPRDHFVLGAAVSRRRLRRHHHRRRLRPPLSPTDASKPASNEAMPVSSASKAPASKALRSKAPWSKPPSAAASRCAVGSTCCMRLGAVAV